MPNVLHDPTIAAMIKGAQLRTYAKGQTILYPDERSLDMYIIDTGAVSMHDIDEQGNRKILHIFGPPALFPMVSFSTDTVTSGWFYTALTDTQVFVLPYAKLKDRLETLNDPTAYSSLLKQLLDEVHELLVRMANSMKATSEERLVGALKFLAKHHTKARSSNWSPVNFPVQHHLLADMTGLTRETVSVSMKQLQQKKLVRYLAPGKLEINTTRLYKM